MKINFKPLVIALGFSFTFVQCQVVVAADLSRNQIYAVAKKITVVIAGSNSKFGSGVIVKKEGDVYTVVTNAHVVHYKNVKQEVIAYDNQRYPVNLKNIKIIPGLDLASVQFTSKDNYAIAKLGDSSDIGVVLGRNDIIYSAGFIRGTSTNKPTYNFVAGKILENTSGQGYKPQFHDEGYDLSHTGQIRRGMSGGPILNIKGELVGINGRVIYRGKFEDLYKSLGIPVNTIRSYLLLDQQTATTSMTLKPKSLEPKTSGCSQHIFANACINYSSPNTVRFKVQV